MPASQNAPYEFDADRPKHSLFFAIMMPSTAAAQVEAVFTNCRQHYPIQKQLIPDSRLHITLEHLYSADSLPEPVVKLSRKIGGAIRFVEFDLILDRILSYRNRQRENPLVMSADQPSAGAVNGLVREIRRALSILATGGNWSERPMTPHMTLAWERAMVPEQEIDPVKLSVRDFVLVHSHVGQSRYEILGRWQLVPLH